MLNAQNLKMNITKSLSRLFKEQSTLRFSVSAEHNTYCNIPNYSIDSWKQFNNKTFRPPNILLKV